MGRGAVARGGGYQAIIFLFFWFTQLTCLVLDTYHTTSWDFSQTLVPAVLMGNLEYYHLKPLSTIFHSFIAVWVTQISIFMVTAAWESQYFSTFFFFFFFIVIGDFPLWVSIVWSSKQEIHQPSVHYASLNFSWPSFLQKIWERNVLCVQSPLDRTSRCQRPRIQPNWTEKLRSCTMNTSVWTSASWSSRGGRLKGSRRKISHRWEPSFARDRRSLARDKRSRQAKGFMQKDLAQVGTIICTW